MPKRRRLLNTAEKKKKAYEIKEESPAQVPEEGEVWSARGRLKGALRGVLESPAQESESSEDDKEWNPNTEKSKSNLKMEYDEDSRDRKSPPRASYVLKLFDRSVDLSQFKEDSPLYPICRAWMHNQPKANYKEIGMRDEEEEDEDKEGVKLPGPEGPVLHRAPPLLPEQATRNKDNINLNYKDATPWSREQLLRYHVPRWAAVRRSWLDQAALCEQRYSATQETLNRINVNSL